MISTETVSQSVVVAHTTALLAEPTIGARALAIVASGERLRSLSSTEGFLLVQDGGGRQGYLPAALCAPQALDAADGGALTYVVQPVSLYHNPSPGSQATHKWVIPPEELLQVVGPEGQFVPVQRSNGQRGYVPALLADRSPGQSAIRVRQPVSLYHSPVPGGQFSMLVAPEEPLLVLGKDERFVLVQREDGRLGYVPAVLCGQVQSDTLFKAGPIDLGWVGLGCFWTLLNWGGLATLITATFFIDPPLKPYLGMALLLGTTAALWFASRRRLVARSFAIGLLLCYAFLHLVSGGSATLWPR